MAASFGKYCNSFILQSPKRRQSTWTTSQSAPGRPLLLLRSNSPCPGREYYKKTYPPGAHFDVMVCVMTPSSAGRPSSLPSFTITLLLSACDAPAPDVEGANRDRKHVCGVPKRRCGAVDASPICRDSSGICGAGNDGRRRQGRFRFSASRHIHGEGVRKRSQRGLQAGRTV